MTIDFAPLLPLAALLALTVLSIGVAGVHLWERRRGGPLRLIAMAALLVILGNIRRKGLPCLLVQVVCPLENLAGLLEIRARPFLKLRAAGFIGRRT